MSSVDDRIVNMQFNNKQFSAAASQSKRDLEGVERAISNAGKSQGLEQMGSAVDGVKARFSALQIIGVTALANIANSAVNSAKTFLGQFTMMNSAMEGFQEYELKMGSIQTIMANTGESLKTVNAKLNELNKYSDKTIYNFGDMTKNIGLFTNAGIGLADATAMIKGFSNEAAVSGTTSANAAGAAYQLSQALSAGTIRLMDWRSLSNVGMGNAKMKDGIIEIAQAMGQFEGQSETAALAQKDFNGSLEKNWLSADVMSNYLKIQAGELSKAQMRNIGLTDQQIRKFEENQKVAENAATKVRTWTQLVGTVRESLGSGWSQSAELVIGDFHQATKLFTNINNTVGGVLGKMTASRNKMLKEWASEGGRTDLFKSLGRMATSVGSIFKALGAAWREVFPPSSGNIMLSITNGLKALSKFLKPTKETLENLQSVFQGFFSILKIGFGIIGGVVAGFAALFGAIFSGAGDANLGLLGMVAAIADVITGFQAWLTESANVRTILTEIGSTAGAVLNPLISAIGSVIAAFAALGSGQGIEGFMAPFGDAKASLVSFVSELMGGLGKLTAPFASISSFFRDIQTKLESLHSSLNVTDELSAGVSKISSATKGARDAVTGLYEGFSGSAASAATDAQLQLVSAGEQASDRWGAVKGIMANVGTGIKNAFTALGDAASWVKSQLGDLFSGMGAMEWASLFNAFLTGAALISIKKFGDGLEGLLTSFAGVGTAIKDTFGALTDTLETMQQAVKAEMIRNIAIAVALLTASVIALTFVDGEKLAISLGAIGAMLGMLVGALWGLGKVQSEVNMAVLGASILMISMAMVNLALAVVILGKQDLGTLAKGLGAMAIGLGLMVAALNSLHGISGKLVAAGAAMVLIATAMNILAGAVAIFGHMSLETLGLGLFAMAVGIKILTVSLQMLSKNPAGVLAAAGAIAIMSSAMIMLSAAVLAFGSMDLETLAKGMAAVAIGLGIMVGALLLLSNFSGQATVAAGAMIIMAMALNMLVGVILTLGTVSWDVISQGLRAMAIALAIVLAAGLLAYAVAPGLAALGIAVGLLGAAMLMAGVGMLAFGTGFALLAAAGVAGTAVIVAAIQAFMALLPSIAVQVAAAFVAFIEVIANASPRIRKAFGTILRNMIGTVRDAIPQLRKLLQDLIDNGIRVLTDSIPQWIELGWTVIDAFIESARKHVPRMAENAILLMTEFLAAIERRFPMLADQAARTIVAFVQGIADAVNNNIDDLREAALDLAWAIVNGLTGGLLGAGARAVQNAVESLGDMIPDWARHALQSFSPSRKMIPVGEAVGTGMARGIGNSVKAVVTSTLAMARAVLAAGDVVISEAMAKADQAQARADDAAAKAEITEARAKAAQNRADDYAKKHPKDKEGIKARNKAARRLGGLAEGQRRRADKAQTDADAAAQSVADARAFQEADLEGKGDIRAEQSQELAARASRALSKANAEATEAKRLQKISKKAAREMLKESKKSAERARALARQAQDAAREANSFYQQEVEARIRQLQEDAAYEAADDAGKAAILRARAEANDARAQAQRAASAALISQAQAIASSDAAQALNLVEQAEAAAKAAEDAANLAQQERDQAEQLLDPGTTSSTGSGTETVAGTTIQIARSVLEEAAKAVDRYTESLRQAEESAAAQAQPVQFVQNNTSPEALSASELYRQTRNLLSVAEIKMGANPVTVP